MAYIVENNMTPQWLFKEANSIHNYNTRLISNRNSDAKYCKIKVKSMSISINGITLWNDLDKHRHKINCPVRFRQLLRQCS